MEVRKGVTMFKHFGFVVFMAVFLSACAPQYAVKTLYSLPDNSLGKACVQTCSSQRNICATQCNRQYEQCLVKAEQIGKESYRELKREYHHQYYIYERMMVQYDIAIAKWSSQKHSLNDELEYFNHECAHAKKRAYVCRRANEVDGELHRLKKAEPPIPLSPREPVLAEQVKYSMLACNRSCGCEPEYDSCFVSCGGVLRYENYCIKNCE